ncbi:hypothetical protein CBR_g56604 [Chara braunii]|uniref:Reverse transcriptase domain-containing protein n=1 Tax=Chara braunii TaxID=69332 RepID=A0A388MDT8_CHABU|nr:hypothetical protein CBR_g56604 [Chara braunii]|eukprot:GBG92639.1 hypothetical protein CBR_g56604 [Chara braunii]
MTEVRAFLGVVGFWRIFIKNFAKIAEPIRAMIREEGTMDWTEEREGDVQKLKDIFTSETVALSAPCFNDEVGRPFILETDGGPLAVGGVLIQRDEGGKEKPSRFKSRTLNSAERRYSQFKKEDLAILHCLKTFQAYLFGRRFILRIDPTNVAGALKNYRPIDPTVGRWVGFIWQFDYKIERIAGIRNKADGLSRAGITPEGVEDAEPIDAFLEYEGGTLAVDNERMSEEYVEELMRFMADLEPVIRDLIREYRDVFPPYFSYSGIPPMRGVEHSIQLVPDYRVHHQAPYRLSIPEATKLKRQLKELLRLGFIKPSNSPWGAPVLFARKADGTLRLCIDYRGLNRYTVKNSYPMPRADELFDRLAGNRFFTKIDLRSGYHQIRVAAEDQPKTAFRSRLGHYEFTVMPFGLTNAPATFQTVMKDIFRDILEEYVLVYLDDILVYSRTLEDHIRHLRDVLQCLRKHGFYTKLSKCRFAQRKVDFLGHHESDQGLHMDDAKITAIEEWPDPTSAQQLCSFQGLTSYYSNFIQGYARYSYVLTSTLLRKNPPWFWTPLCEDAFRGLKKEVTCAPVLRLPDFDRPFIVTTDASDFAVGVVLSQVFASPPASPYPHVPPFPMGRSRLVLGIAQSLSSPVSYYLPR